MFAQCLVGPAESGIVSQSTNLNFNCCGKLFTYNVVLGKKISIFPNFPFTLFMAVITFFHTILSFVPFWNRKKKQKLKVVCIELLSENQTQVYRKILHIVLFTNCASKRKFGFVCLGIQAEVIVASLVDIYLVVARLS